MSFRGCCGSGGGGFLRRGENFNHGWHGWARMGTDDEMGRRLLWERRGRLFEEKENLNHGWHGLARMKLAEINFSSNGTDGHGW